MKIINVELPKEHDYIETYPIGYTHIGDRLQERKRDFLPQVRSIQNNIKWGEKKS